MPEHQCLSMIPRSHSTIVSSTAAKGGRRQAGVDGVWETRASLVMLPGLPVGTDRHWSGNDDSTKGVRRMAEEPFTGAIGPTAEGGEGGRGTTSGQDDATIVAARIAKPSC